MELTRRFINKSGVSTWYCVVSSSDSCTVAASRVHWSVLEAPHHDMVDMRGEGDDWARNRETRRTSAQVEGNWCS